MTRKRKHSRRRNIIGRPCKYNHAIARKICRNVARGCSREAASALAGVSPSTLYEWRQQFSEFSEGLEKADARFEAECVASIRKAGRSSRNWTANAWLLERKFPQRYGKVERHLIRASREGAPLPEEYIKAINAALGVTGELKPLRLLPDGNGSNELPALPQGEGGRDLPLLPDGSNGDGEVDLDILPQG